MAIKVEFVTEHSKWLDGMRKIQDSVKTTTKTINDSFDAQAAAVEKLSREMEQLAAEIDKAESAGDTKTVEQKRHAFEELGKELEKEKKNFEEMNAAFGKMGSGGGGGGAQDNMMMKLRMMRKEITSLTIEYRHMSDEEKQSAKGRELEEKINRLTKEAAEFQDVMGDVANATKNLASDTRNWDILSGGINLATSAIGGFTGALSMFGAKEEDLQEIQTKLQASLAVSNALTQIQNNIQKESALMLGVRSIQEAAAAKAIAIRTAAEGKGAIATKAATIAQKAFNLVAKANPYVLLATALVTVVGAFWAFSRGAKKAAEEEKRLQEEAAKAAEEQKKMSETIGNAVGEVIGKYMAMQVQWRQLSSEQEKAQWVKDNQQAFHALGLSVNSVNDAEQVLVNMAPQVIAALKAVAEAEAYQQLYTEAVKDRITNWENRHKSVATGDYYNPVSKQEKREQSRIPKEWEDARLRPNVDYTIDLYDQGNTSRAKYTLTSAGVKRLNQVRSSNAQQRRYQQQQQYDDKINTLEKGWEEAMLKANEAQSRIPQRFQYTGGGGGGSSRGGNSGGGRGSTWDAQKAEADRVRLYNKWKEDLLSTAFEESENYTDAYIADMEDSTDKALREIDQQEGKALAEIEEKRKKLIADARQLDLDIWKKSAQGNDEYNYTEKSEEEYLAMIEEAVPDLLATLDAQASLVSARFNKRREEVAKQEADAMREYLKQYGDYQQQRLAITEDYDEQIRKAQTEGEKLMLGKQKEEALRQVDERYGLVTQAMADLFADASKKSVKAIQAIIDKYTKLVEYMEGHKTDASDDELAALGLSQRDIERVKAGELSLKDLTDRLKELKGELKDRSPYQSFVGNMKVIIEQLKEAKNAADLGEAVGAMTAEIKAFLPAVKDFSNNVGNIFGADNSTINGVIDGFSGLMSAGGGIGQIMSGDIVGGVMNTVSGISQMVDAFDGLFGADYSSYKNLVDQYTRLISVWDTLIGKKKEYLAESYGADAMRAEKEAERLLANEMEAWRTLGRERLNSCTSAGSHSIGVRIRQKMTDADWSGVGYDLGGRLEGLFDLSAKQLEELRANAPTFWAKLDDDVRKYLENIINGAEQLEQIQEQARNQFTSTTFDSVYDSFVSSLADMDKSAYDFSKDFEKYMFNAVLNAQVSKLFKTRLEDWYKAFAAANEDGMLSESEIASLRYDYDQIMKEGIAMRDDLAKLTNYGSSGEGDATFKSVSSFTQEQGDILNGRLTAIQIGVQTGNVLRQQISNSLTAMNALVGGSSAAVDDMRDLVAMSNTHLADIVSLNKKMLTDFTERIDRIVINTQNL